MTELAGWVGEVVVEWDQARHIEYHKDSVRERTLHCNPIMAGQWGAAGGHGWGRECRGEGYNHSRELPVLGGMSSGPTQPDLLAGDTCVDAFSRMS